LTLLGHLVQPSDHRFTKPLALRPCIVGSRVGIAGLLADWQRSSDDDM
jgi:hypothetical protein